MNGMDLFSYIESVPFDTANAALFYCTRAFDFAQRPKAWRPDIFFDHPSCVPGPEVRRITLAILAAIEADAKKELDQLDKESFDAYWWLVRDAGDILDARQPDCGDPERVDEFLRKMREHWERPVRG